MDRGLAGHSHLGNDIRQHAGVAGRLLGDGDSGLADLTKG